MIGKKILNYEIKSLLGEGGMGNVYLAEHIQLGRKVAIKVLHQQLVKNDSLRARFKNEASTMAHLQHSNIVSLFDYVEEPDGLYLIMELVDGVTMEQYILQQSGPIPADKAIPIMKQILDAVAYAHQAGVVHRDIKPANILLTKNGGVKILDFGIAKLFSDAGNLTKTGTQMGTVFYMSPEQVKGIAVDPRTDIYSLGVTFYQMLTGTGPYSGITTEYEVYNKIVNEPLRAASSVYPGVPPWLDAVIFRATEKNPDNRFQNCQQFAQALSGQMHAGHTVVYGAPPVVPPQMQTQFNQPVQPNYASTVINPNPMQSMPQPPKKKKGMLVLIFCIVFTLIAAGCVVGYIMTRPDPEEVAHKSTVEYCDCIKNSVKDGMSSIEIQAASDKCKKKVEAQLKEGREMFAGDAVKLNRFNIYYDHAADSANAVVTGKFNAALASQLLPHLWRRVGEEDPKNYLVNFKNDSVFLPNRKGAYTYAMNADMLEVTGKGGSSKGKVIFRTLDEFVLRKENGDSVVYQVALTKDSMLGSYSATNANYSYDYYWDTYVYDPDQYSVTFKPNGEVVDGGTTYKFDIVNGDMIWYYKSSGELFKNFGHWYLKGMNKLMLKNANTTAMARTKAKQADSPDILFTLSKPVDK